ncbi:MAG: thioredoxin domain-containing protein, partial [Bdellovibrionales bacterium]|nr:thioredoxin domain-containing protein [Bdellovibrionales bacterium]
IILSYRENKAWSDRQSAELLGALEKLRDIRGRRDSPSLDTKIITAWNGIMISAMALAHRVCAEQRYYDRAQAAAKFIRDRLFYDQQLMRSYCEGEVKHPACLEDYVFFIDGLLSLYQSDFDPDWLRLALNLQQIQDRKLWDVQDNLYFFAQENELFARKKEVFDGAIPSANNQAVLNLLRLDFFFPNNGFATRARAILRRLSHLMGRYPRAFPTALCSLDASLSGIDSLVIAYGSQKRAALDIIREVRMAYCPDLLVCVHTEELSALKEKMGLNNKNTYYLCAGNVCYPATTKPDEIKVLLEGVVK